MSSVLIAATIKHMLSDENGSIQVRGTSMLPYLKEGNHVIIQDESKYKEGDILLIHYKSSELLIHRLVCRKKRTFICKGDNAFRLEEVDRDQVLGKLVGVVETKEADYLWSKWKVHLSYCIGVQAKRSGYELDRIKKSLLYRIYRRFVLGLE